MKLIIDTDPGTDDAVAILIALAYFSDEEILGITTVAGNVKVEIGTNNALRILEHADRNKIPVYEGEKAPLERKLLTAEWVHGTDGLNFVPFPSPSKEKEKKDAVTFLKESLDNSDEKVNLCVLGPMTNIGKLLQKFPEISTKIEKIIFMGGGAGFGNHTPVAEFNILVDPEAANIVFKSGVELVMMGLDVTHQAISTKERLEKIISTNTETGKFLADLMGSLSDIVNP